MSVTLPPLTAFRTWLASLSPETIVGTRCTADSCPLAHWLTDVLHQKVCVESETIEVLTDPYDQRWEILITPTDYLAFVLDIDAALGDDTEADLAVTAREALEALVIIEKEG